MALIDLKNIRLGFGGHPLFDDINLQLESGERCCLVGRNGAGKTTLFKLIAGIQAPDSGTIARRQGLKVSWVPQDIPDDLTGSVRDIVAAGLADAAAAGQAPDGAGRDEVAWILSRMELDGGQECAMLSGGMKRRVLLARALVSGPEILLLDEPTNHLDIASIVWLENFLLREQACLFFITHDRAFARRLATRVSEIDRGRLLHFNCGYGTYIERRQDQLLAEEKQDAEFQKKLAVEEAWIRRGVKARRTRDEGRVKALKEMRRTWAERRERTGTVRMSIGGASRSGDLVAELEQVGFAWPGSAQPVIQDCSCSILRGDKLGLIGPNGCGKTTLVRLLLGELAPVSGRVRLGSALQVVYFDQLRHQLDPSRTVRENLAGDDDSVIVHGQSRHVLAYLQDFLFSAERARSPVSILSGGERNRLLLAKLFLKPANLLVLDEPTNDLDAETLDLLENLLVEFAGTLIMVSHDRDFLDQVVTGCLVIEGDGRIGEYAGGYSDWLVQKQARDTLAKERTGLPVGKPAPGGDAGASAGDNPPRRPRKISFKERQELDGLPERIADLEARIDRIHQELADPQVYRDGPKAARDLQLGLEGLETELAAAYARWEELEALS